ncbi:hypothetical protein KL86PLE_10299 [uncultured Pleomorphomonas sp.]|uniref:Uncharacterized protein n=1 Tax=uncultured Pleomorphomonas sp. TaxID=442121 RepID=A0A212L033_9HYPH|nr:hypothetical protein KL86PLE_10299 [uncultured Pleomorphomonas sp.]
MCPAWSAVDDVGFLPQFLGELLRGLLAALVERLGVEAGGDGRLAGHLDLAAHRIHLEAELGALRRREMALDRLLQFVLQAGRHFARQLAADVDDRHFPQSLGQRQPFAAVAELAAQRFGLGLAAVDVGRRGAPLDREHHALEHVVTRRHGIGVLFAIAHLLDEIGRFRLEVLLDLGADDAAPDHLGADAILEGLDRHAALAERPLELRQRHLGAGGDAGEGGDHRILADDDAAPCPFLKPDLLVDQFVLRRLGGCAGRKMHGKLQQAGARLHVERGDRLVVDHYLDVAGRLGGGDEGGAGRRQRGHRGNGRSQERAPHVSRDRHDMMHLHLLRPFLSEPEHLPMEFVKSMVCDIGGT